MSHVVGKDYVPYLKRKEINHSFLRIFLFSAVILGGCHLVMWAGGLLG